MIRQVKSTCCPDANGRQPKDGEQSWTLRFPLENGQDYMEVKIGKRGRDALLDMLGQEAIDDNSECKCVCHNGKVGMPHLVGECCDECQSCGIRLARPMYKHKRLCVGNI